MTRTSNCRPHPARARSTGFDPVNVWCTYTAASINVCHLLRLDSALWIQLSRFSFRDAACQIQFSRFRFLDAAFQIRRSRFSFPEQIQLCRLDLSFQIQLLLVHLSRFSFSDSFLDSAYQIRLSRFSLPVFLHSAFCIEFSRFRIPFALLQQRSVRVTLGYFFITYFWC